MPMFSTSTWTRCLGFSLGGRRSERSRRRPAGRPPGMEPLEDRRLLSYTITNLGSLGGTFVFPMDVNNRGEVVGLAATANNAANHAFLYRGGRMIDLGTLGGADSEATGINDRGDVVGTSGVATGSERVDAFIVRGGKITDLGPVDAETAASGLVSINASGVISGLSNEAEDAVIIRRGKETVLGALGGLGSVATGLNNSGQVAGFSATGTLPPANGSPFPTIIFHAFLYSHGTMRDLGTLGGVESYANGINNRGIVVGDSLTANDAAQHAFVDSWGKMTDLGTLGGQDSLGSAINDQGVVVGSSLTSASVKHGFIEQHGRMVDLNSLIPSGSGLVITAATGINDRGQIVAEGYQTSSPTDVLGLLLSPSRSAR
jgi:probable HAF family extracellular repeat protein